MFSRRSVLSLLAAPLAALFRFSSRRYVTIRIDLEVLKPHVGTTPYSPLPKGSGRWFRWDDDTYSRTRGPSDVCAPSGPPVGVFRFQKGRRSRLYHLASEEEYRRYWSHKDVREAVLVLRNYAHPSGLGDDLSQSLTVEADV